MEQLNWQVPDYLAISVGDGCTIAGVWKGLKDLYAIGFIDRLPRLISAQAEGCCPLNRAIAENQPWRTMAIDYGDAHTGIAISDPTGFMAGTTTVINAYRPEQVAQGVKRLAEEYAVEELVLGYPKNMDGSLGPRAEKAESMKAKLEEVGAKVELK